MMEERLIHGPDCVAEGVAYLCNIEPRFETAFAETGPLPLRLRKDGFSALLDAIVSQQISVAAADSIWEKLKKAKFTSAKAMRVAPEEDLRACGLSRPKIRYAKALADASINYRRLHNTSMENVVNTLTEVTGIGKWTAEIYAMFSLARADGFAAGDLALQESARILFDLKDRPSEKQLEEMAEAWRPWRSVAARQLWAYYRIAKQREGIRT
ncbi:MAG: DNA-3-methyladenine glycosylase 2 family protein [Pseudomonadota bacterium]